MNRILAHVTYWNKIRAFGFCETLDDRPVAAFIHIRNVENRQHLVFGDLVSGLMIPSPEIPGKFKMVEVRLNKRDETPALSSLTPDVSGVQQ